MSGADTTRLTIESPEDLAAIGRALSSMNIGLTLVDRSMRVAWSNEATRRLAAELRVGGHHCFEALWKRRDRCPDCLSLLVLRTGEPQEGIRERGRPGLAGELYRVSSIPVFDRSGQVRWVLESLVPLPALGVGLTNRLHPPPRALAAPGASAALVVIDAEERIVSWSPSAEVMLGFAVEHVLGRRVDIIIPEDRQSEEQEVARRVAREGSVPRFETVRLARDGRLVPVAAWAEVLRDESGSAIGRTCWLEDMSAVERLRRRVVEQERMLAHITHEVDDAIVGLDLSGVVRSWNRGAVRRFGRAAHEVLGTSLAGVVGADELQRLLERIRQGAVQSLRMRWRDAHGEMVPVDVSATLVRGDDGAPELVALVARDVSERLRLDRQIVRSEKMAVVGSLAAGLAHEIGTPLNVISAKAEYLMLDTAGAAQRGELQGIVAETDRISRLVRDLLGFARGEKPGLVDVELGTTVDRVLGLLRIALDKRAISVLVELERDLPPIPMEPDALHQLLLNLLMNAVAAVPDKGSVGIRAWTLQSRSAAGIAIEVHDNGPGVPPDLAERIFDPFFTTRPDGTGLGLAVCSRIVSTHGGDIRVSTGPLGGASFTVQLPIKREAEA